MFGPQPRATDDTRPTSAIPIEEKKTFAWIKGLRRCNEVAAELPETRQVIVMDREADFYELFDEQRSRRSNCWCAQNTTAPPARN